MIITRVLANLQSQATRHLESPVHIGIKVNRRGKELQNALSDLKGPIGAYVTRRTIDDHSPLATSRYGYLALTEREVALFSAEPRLISYRLRPIAAVPRTQLIGGRLDDGVTMDILELRFNDGTAWSFEVQRFQRQTARELVNTLYGLAESRPLVA